MNKDEMVGENSYKILLTTWKDGVHWVELSVTVCYFDRLKTKRKLLYLKTQSVPRCKHFSSRL